VKKNRGFTAETQRTQREKNVALRELSVSAVKPASTRGETEKKINIALRTRYLCGDT
jgi:hypothetical protein